MRAGAGRVVRVGFTPVKGMRHAAYDEVVLDAQGPVGDRGLCLVDVARQRVLRTVRHPSLLAVQAHRDGATLSVELPSGETARGPLAPTGERLVYDYWGRDARLELLDGPHAALVSAYLGRPVRLAAAPRGEVVYGAEVSLVSSASLRELADRAGEPALAEQGARFRPTLVLDVDGPPHVEDTWLGRELAVGDAVLRVHRPIPRCAVIDLDPTTGRKDARVLKALAGYRPRDVHGTRDLLFAVDAHVVTPGTVRPGDVVALA